MSHVTDLVFIAPTREAAEIFQDAIEAHKDYRPQPLESGDHATSCYVFHLGVDYMPGELREWLLDGPASWGWPVGAVMYLYGEDDADPTVIVAERNGRPVTAELIQGPDPLLCVGCFLEVHAGQREHANHAALIVGGNSTCTEHLHIGPAPQQQLPDRTQGGIIIPGGPINGGR